MSEVRHSHCGVPSMILKPIKTYYIPGCLEQHRMLHLPMLSVQEKTGGLRYEPQSPLARSVPVAVPLHDL